MGRMWKSRHAGLNAKIRSALEQRHPVTGDVIGRTPAIRAEFGFPTGESAPFRNPLTGEMERLEGYQGGFFDLDSVADQNGWDDDIKAMVERRLDELCRQMPGSIQSVDFITAPAEKPWPTFDEETDIERIFEFATALGLVSKTLAYERENKQRAAITSLLEDYLDGEPEQQPEPPPVVAQQPRQVEQPLERVSVV